MRSALTTIAHEWQAGNIPLLIAACNTRTPARAAQHTVRMQHANRRTATTQQQAQNFALNRRHTKALQTSCEATLGEEGTHLG